MVDPAPMPPGWRLFAAFCLAPGIAALIGALTLSWWYSSTDNWFRGVLGFTYGASVSYAYPVAIFLGLPAYYILRGRVRASAINCAIAGAMLALLPLLIFSIFQPPRLSDLLGIAQLMLSFGLGGAVTGLLFWIIAAAEFHSLADSAD